MAEQVREYRTVVEAAVQCVASLTLPLPFSLSEENFGSDPLLVAKMAEAAVIGLQVRDPSTSPSTCTDRATSSISLCSDRRVAYRRRAITCRPLGYPSGPRRNTAVRTASRALTGAPPTYRIKPSTISTYGHGGPLFELEAAV